MTQALNNLPNLDVGIFRAYDIRGIVDKNLTPEVVSAIGQAFASEAQLKGEKIVVIARDGRLSGPSLLKALAQGIQKGGCDVIDIGAVPTPLLYFATHVLNTRTGVMLTGSHNPADYNGLKLVIAGETLAEESIQRLYRRVRDQDFMQGTGSYQQQFIVEKYIERIAQDVHINRPLKIVVDAGNGIAGNVAPRLYRQLGCEVVEIFCEVDGRFPNHHPDPSEVKNLQDLIAAVKEHQADIGLAFDGDADRLGVVTNKGEIIWADRQLMLYAIDILSRYPGSKIIFDVKCSSHLVRVIAEHGGEPLMWKTGHSLVKAKLRETGALLAGEMSGHTFFKERWYGFDDGLYTGARLLEILGKQPLTADELFSQIPNSVNTPELKLMLPESEKFVFMQKFIEQAKFDGGNINTIDGIRVDFADGWGLVRPSNTTPCLVLRFEANDEPALQRIQHIFREQLLNIDSRMVLPF